MRKYRYTSEFGWLHTLDFADNFKAIDFFKTNNPIIEGVQDIIATKVVSMKTTTTKSVYDWLKAKPNIDNIRNLTEGFTKGITWVNKTIRYTEGTAAIHIYMPKANITEALRIEWIKVLQQRHPNLEFELKSLEDYMNK